MSSTEYGPVDSSPSAEATEDQKYYSVSASDKSATAEIKRRTIELYDQLPMDEEGRKARLDIRDQVIELNYNFFGFVASHTYIQNSSISYEDKVQSCLSHFLECWWWFRWPVRYRTDLSFSVFFKPRLGEMIERELNDVKYSVRRSLCMEAGAQVGKHWGQVKYDDLARVNLPADKLNALKAIFGTLYVADIAEHGMYIEAPDSRRSEFDDPSDNYDTIEELLIHEMIWREDRLTPKTLMEIADMYTLDFLALKAALPEAEKQLYLRLKEAQDYKDS